MEIIEKNVVVLGVDRYNMLQKDQTKFKLFIEKMFEEAILKEDGSDLTFEMEDFENYLKLAFSEQYKKRLSSLRTSKTKQLLKEKNKIDEEYKNERV